MSAGVFDKGHKWAIILKLCNCSAITVRGGVDERSFVGDVFVASSLMWAANVDLLTLLRSIFFTAVVRFVCNLPRVRRMQSKFQAGQRRRLTYKVMYAACFFEMQLMPMLCRIQP